jgi:uncharacterized Fe-S radical SAM superfamily protein PflX
MIIHDKERDQFKYPKSATENKKGVTNVEFDSSVLQEINRMMKLSTHKGPVLQNVNKHYSYRLMFLCYGFLSVFFGDVKKKGKTKKEVWSDHKQGLFVVYCFLSSVPEVSISQL